MSLFAPSPVAGQEVAVGVTGAGEAIFPGGTTFNGFPLSGLELGQGLFSAPNGSATGYFYAVLRSSSFLRVAQDIDVQGQVSVGAVAPASQYPPRLPAFK